jgi:hypothetical protein
LIKKAAPGRARLSLKEGNGMVIYVSESGSDRTEIIETLLKEGVTYQERKAVTEREAGFSSVGMVEIQANLPEVFPVPPEFVESDSSVRVWRLPSGKMIVSDMDGNLEQITVSSPR